jgi:hypothetical protein
MTSLSKKPVAKKRGRPFGSKNKSAAKAKSFKQLDIAALQNKIAELEIIRERLHSVIDRQEYKAVQYQAVIDYLETKLELK